MNFRPQNIAQEERSKLDKIINTPSNISGRSLLGKTLLGVVVGAMMSIILLVVMSAFGVAVKTDTVSTGVAMTVSMADSPLSWVYDYLFWKSDFSAFILTFLLSKIYSSVKSELTTPPHKRNPLRYYDGPFRYFEGYGRG